MATLYDLSKEFEDLASNLESSEDLSLAIIEKFKDLEIQHSDKVQGYIDLIEAVRANAAFYSLKSERLKQKSKAAEKIEKLLLERMKFCIEQNPNLPWKATNGDKVSLRNSPQRLELKGFTTFNRSVSNVIEFSEVEIDPKFIDIINLNCLNTDRVKDHLKNIGELSWAHLKTDQHVRIY